MNNIVHMTNRARLHGVGNFERALIQDSSPVADRTGSDKLPVGQRILILAGLGAASWAALIGLVAHFAH